MNSKHKINKTADIWTNQIEQFSPTAVVTLMLFLASK